VAKTELRTETEIRAPPARVWSALTDFAAYPEWNPFIGQVSGALEVGSVLMVLLNPPGGREERLKARVLKVEPEHELRWMARMWFKGLFDTEHFFLLNATPSGATRLVQGQDVSGLFLRTLTPTLTYTARGLVGMNAALKRRVEG
jgi:hypothetical protein